MIKIIIERRIMPGLEDEYEQAARDVMRLVQGVAGFAGGESLVESENSHRRLVITQWRDLRAWKDWSDSSTRQQALQKMLPLLTEDEHVRIFKHSY
ncbi:antibiotic biosynthesis monooxygenase family protein [Halomonas halocynthiae]|uniref:antibiotic biosynthesis monooxygenase family protein n=1 Tax=Halomonas halocynthiae TaxID=176290 RepID=UPI00040A4084|nr:antibiotic biosynthesis monooxygenase [Halomonas halocynthiae]